MWVLSFIPDWILQWAIHGVVIVGVLLTFIGTIMATKPPVEGKGTLFPSKKKAHPKAPDWYGEIMYKGEIIKLGGWHKKGEGQYGPWELISIAVDDYGSKPRDITPYGGGNSPKSWSDDVPF